jgi:hypothetical protein
LLGYLASFGNFRLMRRQLEWVRFCYFEGALESPTHRRSGFVFAQSTARREADCPWDGANA